MHLFNFLLLGFQSSASLIMWLLLALFFISLALAIERFWYLFMKCDNGTSSFMETISKYIKGILTGLPSLPHPIKLLWPRA